MVVIEHPLAVSHGHGDLIQNVFLIGLDLQECIHVNKDHTLKGELTIEVIQDSEKAIIKRAQLVAS